MEAEGRAGDDERAARLTQVEAMRVRGEDPYPVRFDRTHTLAEIREHWDDRIETGTTSDDMVRVAGRVWLRRVQGKLVFVTLRDGPGELQLFVNKAELGDDPFARFVDEIERGDWVGVEGTVMKTKRGELSVNVKTFSLLSKSLRPLPEKWHGLTDTDTRFRQRYVDLIANDDARRVFAVRFAAIASMRAFLTERGFVEVETPVLHPILGGATARPFVTHHNALDTDFYLRVAPELYLKRLIVGGLDKVFEVARVFRNEGVSTRHNPEFTMLELYEAFADYTDMMALTEQMIARAATETVGTTVIEWDGQTIDLTPPFARRTMIDLVKEHGGVSVHPSQPVAQVRALCDELDVPYQQHWGSGKLLLEIYEKTTEAKLVAPTYVCDYPLEVSPLARTHRDDPTLTERFELIIGGREIANAFSELNDPVEQRRRFEAQAELKRRGDAEANDIDEDYLRALEYGLPPCGGMGTGIDRIVMLLAGVTSIKEVILFPHLRPEADNLRQEDA
ncbi:MAG: lysine--tRNA ligase [Acidimicrobiia bacterium]